MNLFIIDLDKTTSDEMGFAWVVFGDCHDLTEGSRNDTFALF